MSINNILYKNPIFATKQKSLKTKQMKKLLLPVLLLITITTNAQLEELLIDTQDMLLEVETPQGVAVYETEVIEVEYILTERLDIYLMSENMPWESFQQVSLRNALGAEIYTKDDLHEEEEWTEINDSTYRLRLYEIYDIIDYGYSISHTIYFTLHELAEVSTFNTYLNLKTSDSNGFVSLINSDTSRFNIISTVGIDESHNFDISVYPNPVTNQFQISGVNTVDINSIQIFDMTGSVAETFSGNETFFDISHLPSGSYFVRLTGDRVSKTEKINKL